MTKSKTRTHNAGNAPETGKMVHPDGLDHPITLKLCKRLNRFYEPLNLLSSLNEACGRSIQCKAASDNFEPGASHSRTLECFINKMAQICDNQRGGSTVTSLAIVRLPDTLLYVFASNQRSQDGVREVTHLVLGLLNYLDKEGAKPGFRDDAGSPVTREVLRKILRFNHERIRCYRQGLLQRLSQCLSDCDRDMSEQNNSLKAVLLPLQQMASHKPKDSEQEGVSATSLKDEDLVRAAMALRQSRKFNYIAEKCKAGKIDESQHWCELQHFIGRLVSYFGATQAILGARKRYPELFDTEGLDIRFVDSSKPMPNPMNAFQAGLPLHQRGTVRSAHAIIARMTSDKEKKEMYQQYADELQRCDLDKLIAKHCCKKSFRPIAHSEVLLLEWLRNEFEEETHSIPFYDDVKYIGCSKPTCRLCDYFFAAHSSGVRVRPPHRNVYASWAIPNVLVEDETSQYKTRMIDAVLAKVRDDVFMALREKVSERKRWDSNTCSSQPTYHSLTGDSICFDDLVANVKGLSIASQARIPHVKLIIGKPIGDDAWSTAAQDDAADDDDNGNDNGDDNVEDNGDDGGGVLMFTGRNMRI